MRYDLNCVLHVMNQKKLLAMHVPGLITQWNIKNFFTVDPHKHKLSRTHKTHTAADLAYADGVMCEALCEVEDSVRGQWVILSQEERQ